MIAKQTKTTINRLRDKVQKEVNRYIRFRDRDLGVSQVCAKNKTIEVVKTPQHSFTVVHTKPMLFEVLQSDLDTIPI